MWFAKNKANKAATQRKKTLELQVQRDAVKNNIRLLRAQIQELVEKATKADDLDRRILSLEYEEKKAALNTEIAHFDELSKLISQLNGVANIYERQQLLNQVAKVSDTIDPQAVFAADDMMQARRAVMQEESDALDDVLKNSMPQQHAFAESVEFTQLVREAQLKNVTTACRSVPSAGEPPLSACV